MVISDVMSLLDHDEVLLLGDLTTLNSRTPSMKKSTVVTMMVEMIICWFVETSQNFMSKYKLIFELFR